MTVDDVTGSPMVPCTETSFYTEDIYIFIYIYIYIFICIHTHTHTRTTHSFTHTYTQKVFDRLSVF